MKMSLLVLFVILVFDQIASSYRILGLFPLNGKSHWNMQKVLMKELARRGHQVDVVSHFPLKKPIPNYKDISLKGTAPEVTNNMTATQALDFSTPSMSNLVQKTGSSTCNLFSHPKIQELIKNPPQDPPYDLVIVEVCLMFSTYFQKTVKRFFTTL